jgi:hypothetical protein
VFLGWDRDEQVGEPSYEVSWPEGAFRLDDSSVLAFCLADADEDPTPDDDDGPADDKRDETTKAGQANAAAEESGGHPDDKDEDQGDTNDSDKPREPIDLSIELVDAAGHAARLPLSHVAALQPQIKTPFFKSTLLQSGRLSEPIPRTFLFPLTEFRAINGEFDPAAAVKLRLVFDRTKRGVVIFDKAAFGAAR